ncbi:MAG: AzlD domain-containing protein [Paracoccaceae bacterium]
MIAAGTQVWPVILGLAVGTFLIRFSFLGLVGDRPLPEWLLRLLRYTPVAVIPGLVAPLVLFPQATGGTPDTARLTAAAVTVAVGLLARNTLYAIAAGAVALYGMFWLGF